MKKLIKEKIMELQNDMIASIIEAVKIPSVISDAKEGYPFGENIDKVLRQTLKLCEDLGFRTVNEVLNIRVFDLFNLQDVDNNRAEEFLLTVFKYLYPDKTVDQNIYYNEKEQEPLYKKWSEKHPEFETVKVRDVLIQDGLEVGTMLCVFDYATQLLRGKVAISVRENFRPFSHNCLLCFTQSATV